MEQLTLIIFMILMFVIIMAAFLAFVVMKSFGFKNLFTFFKAKNKEKNGWGLVRLVSSTGAAESYHIMNFNEVGIDEYINLPGTPETELYLFNSKYFARNFFGMLTISYRKGDSEPIDPYYWTPTALSSEGMGVMFAKNAKARAGVDPFAELMKKYFKGALIVGAIILGAVVFMYIRQGDSLDLLIRTSGKAVTFAAQNATMLGK